MRRDVVELREFYAQPLGEAVRETLTRKVFETWGDAPGVDMLGLGYATPFLEPFLSARRVTAAMPMRQGVEPWPAHGRRRSCLVDEAGPRRVVGEIVGEQAEIRGLVALFHGISLQGERVASERDDAFAFHGSSNK